MATSSRISGPIQFNDHRSTVNRLQKGRKEQISKSRSRALIAAAGAALALCASTTAMATTYYWDGNDSTAGFGTASGTWATPTVGTTTSGWSTDVLGLTTVNGNSVTTNLVDTINFGNGSTGILAGSIAPSGTVNVGNITFASGSGAIVLSNASTGTINLAATDVITVNNTVDTISAILSGVGTSLTKAGTGVLSLSGVNTYTGALNINAGSIQLANAGGLGSASVVNVASGSSLLPFATTGTYSAFLNTAGNLESQGGSGTTTWNGAIALLGNATIHSDGGTTINIGGKVNLGAYTLSLRADGGTMTISQPISGAGGIATNSGTTVLSAANTFTGNTTVNAGILSLTNASSLQNSVFDTTASVTGTATAGLRTNQTSLNFGGLTGNKNVAAASGIFTTTTGGYGSVTNVTLNPGIGFSNSYAGSITNGAATTSLTKAGAGTQTLTGSNTYTGSTIVNAGNLNLDFNTTPSNVISTSSALTLGGGTLQLSGTGTQQLNNLNTTASTGSRILLGSSQTLTLGAVGTVGAASAVNFNTAVGGANGASVGSGIVALTGTLPNTFTVTDAGGFGLATLNGSNQVIRQTATALLPASASTAGTDYYVNDNAGGAAAAGSSNLAITASQTVNSLTVDTTTAAGTLTLNSGAVLTNNVFNFGGTGTNTYQITGSAGGAGIQSLASAGTINLNNFNAGTVTISSPILANGANKLVANGTGTTVINNVSNTSGGVAISGGGTLQIGSAGSLSPVVTGIANYSGGIAVSAGSTYRYSNPNTTSTVVGLISGAGGVTVDSGSTLTLWNGSEGGSGYTGPTLITGVKSRLSIGNVTGALPVNTPITIVGDATGGGQFLAGVASMTIPNNFTISGTGTLDDTFNNREGAIRLSTSDNVTGTITLAGNSRIGGFVTSSTISGQITGPFGIDFYGFQNNNNQASSFTISNPNNNYTGNTTIYNSCFQNTNSTGVSTTLKLGASNVIPSGANAGNVAFAINGTDAGATNILDLNGFSNTINGLLVNAGTFATKITNSATGSSVLTIGANDTTSSFSGTITDGGAGKTLGITKIGAGTLTLTGPGTYVGATTVSAGTLALSGSGSILSSSGITIDGNGAKFLHNSSVAVTPSVTLNQGTLTGAGTLTSVNVGAGLGSVLSNNNGSAGVSITIGTLTFNGAATVNTFSASTTAPIVTTSLATNAAGIVTINPTAAAWNVGSTYDLISYGGGSIAGAGFSQFALGTVAGLAPRQATSLVDTGTAVALSITGDTPYWAGDGDGNWNVTSTNNWKLVSAGTYTLFLPNDNVLFNDNATPAGPVAVNIDAANVTPTSTTFNNSTKDYVLSSSGGFGISTGTLIKNGTGTVTITNANTYTGATTVTAGTLNLTGSLTGSSVTTSGTGIVTEGATGVIAGTGVNFVHTSSGTSVLLGVNTYTGSTNVSAGTLQIAGAGQLGSGTYAGNLIISGGTFEYSSSAAQTLSGAITGSGNLLKDTNNSTLTLANAAGFSGLVTVKAGTLGTGAGNTIGTGSMNVSAGATVLFQGAAGNFNGAETWNISGTVTNTGTTFVYLADTTNLINGGTISGSNSAVQGTFLANTGSTVVTATGTGNLISVNDIGMNQSLTFGTPASTDVLTVSSQLGSSNFNNNGTGLFKTGAGTVTLTGSSIYQKPTTVNGGTLQIGNGSSGLDNSTSGFTVASGAILAYDQANGTNTNAKPIVNNGTVTGAEGAGITNTLSGAISGTGVLVQTGAGTTILSATNSYSGGTNVSAGTVALSSAAAFPSGVANSGTPLIVGTGATLQINNHGVAATFMPYVSSLTNSGTINLFNNAMVLRNADTTIGTINSEVAAAYNGGAWNGSSPTLGVITSSVAAADTTHLTAVGVATGLTTFQGASVSANDVLLKYTYLGDANLDGLVDGSDYSRIDNGFLTGLTGWYNGDFNYDGLVNGSDYTLMDNAYNTQGATIAAQLAGPSAIATAQIAGSGATSAVPEPASLGLLGIGVIGLLGRRRRHH